VSAREKNRRKEAKNRNIREILRLVRNDRSARRHFHVQNTRKRLSNVKIRLTENRYFLIFHQKYFVFIKNIFDKKK